MTRFWTGARKRPREGDYDHFHYHRDDVWTAVVSAEASEDGTSDSCDSVGESRTVSISDAALDLDRRDGSTQGGFMVGFTTSALHPQGSASMSPMSWSSHKVKRSVSASLAGEVFMMSEGLAECEWISGVLESAVCQDYEPSLHRLKSISLPEETVTVMKADSHLQIDPSTVCVIDAKSAFDHLVRESTGRSLQTDSTRIMRDQKEHADTEGEVQTGTTRAACDHINKWSKRKLENMTDELPWVVLTRSRAMKTVVAILD